MDSVEPAVKLPVKQNKSVIFGAISGITVLLAIFGLSMQSKKIVNKVPQTPSPSPAPETTPVTEVKNSYKDGTYVAQGDYTYHSGSESITITVTLKDNIITDSQFQGVPKAKPSELFMGLFEKGYKALIIGKNIDEVSLTKVSGSSRTPIGFNDALAKIKAQAKI
jgi:uncharacterized protein with FMN-binding domain